MAAANLAPAFTLKPGLKTIRSPARIVTLLVAPNVSLGPSVMDRLAA